MKRLFVCMLTMVAVAGSNSTDVAFAPTVTVIASVFGPTCAWICAVPGAFATNFPFWKTATFAFVLVQTMTGFAGPPTLALMST